MPAPIANQNAVSHGLRMNLSKVPKGCHYIETAVHDLRRALEALTQEVRGQVGTYEAALIQSACRWEVHAQLCARWLRKEGDSLGHAERIGYSKQVAMASTERDRCLRLLGLDSREVDPFAALYAPDGPASESAAGGEPDQDQEASEPAAGMGSGLGGNEA